MTNVIVANIVQIEPAVIAGAQPKSTSIGWCALPGIPVQGSVMQVNGIDYVTVNFKWFAQTIAETPSPESQLSMATVALFVASPRDAAMFFSKPGLVGATAGALDALKTAGVRAA